MYIPVCWAYICSMPLTIDLSRQFRTNKELTDLVRVIASAPESESEPDWLEWKSAADLSDSSWHMQLAKYIAGFANRDPIVAKRSAGGCSYLVIGVEPGTVHGITPIDNAILHDGISRYLRETVRWNPQYIECAGNTILVVTVEPPEHGDGIVAMLRGFQPHNRGGASCREGDVFVRRHGKTELAKQEDYDMLARRSALAAERADGIGVQVLTTVAAVPVAWDSKAIATWCQRQQGVFLMPLTLGGTTSRRFSQLINLESRSPDEYRRQVAEYLAKMTPLLPEVSRAEAITNVAPSMQLVLINKTEHNFAGVRIEVTIEGNVWGYRNAEDAKPDAPEPPRKWGAQSTLFVPNLSLRMPTVGPLGPYIDNSSSTRIMFDDIDLRPNEQVELDPIYLVCDVSHSGATLTARWNATTSSASGVVSGEFPIHVSSDVFSLNDV